MFPSHHRLGNPVRRLEDTLRRSDVDPDDFAAKHILFQEPGQTPDYIKEILKG